MEEIQFREGVIWEKLGKEKITILAPCATLTTRIQNSESLIRRRVRCF